MLIRLNLGYTGARRGAGVFILQRLPSVQVSQGWLASRLNIATENMNKTNLIPTVPLHPLLTTAGYQSSLLAGKNQTPLQPRHSLVPSKLGFTSCQHNDLM